MSPEAQLVRRAARAEALWDAWAFAAVDAELALAAWFKAAHHLKAATYTAYRKALDREEEAAARLATRISRARY